MIDYSRVVYWNTPRLWSVRIYGPIKDGRALTGCTHTTVGVVAMSAQDAIHAVQSKYENHRVNSCNDSGQVDIVANGVPFQFNEVGQ